MNRSEYLHKADLAAQRAANLASHAEDWAHNGHPSKAGGFAAASTAWAKAACAFLAIARTTTADDKPEA